SPEASLREIQQSSAARLFVNRARLQENALTPDDWSNVASICRHVDGLPLAIELAAANTRSLSLADLLCRLDQRLPLLTDGPRDAPPRHRSMREAIAWT